MAGFISGNATLSAGSVGTAALADNAVTLAKMASGTDGNLIGIDASGNPAYIATGNDGQILTSGGVGVAASMETAAGGGGVVLIQSTDVTEVAAITFTGFNASLYRAYWWLFSNVSTTTDNQHCFLRTSTNGGSSYDSGSGNYEWCSFGMSGDQSAPNGDGALTSSEISLTGNGFRQGTTANENMSGTLWCYSPDDTEFTRFSWHFTGQEDNEKVKSAFGAGARQAVTDVDAVQFLWDASSNFQARGNISFYGITRT